MSVQIISQTLSDICLNLSQGNTQSDYFIYGLSSGLPFYGLQMTTLRTSDKINENAQVRVVFPPTGLLAPTPLVVRWSDTITRSGAGANTGFSTYNSLWCWKTIDFRSASNVIYSLTPQAIIQFMSYTLSPSAYTNWLAMISSNVLIDGITQVRVCQLPLLLPSFTDASNLLDLKRSQSNYDLVFTMDTLTNWAGSLTTSIAETVSMNIDYSWIDLSEADEKNYIENTYLKSDSSLTKAQVVLTSDPRVLYSESTAYSLTRSRLVEQIHFAFFTKASPCQPVDVINGKLAPSVSINLGSGTTTIPLMSLKSFQLFGNGRNFSTGIEGNIYTINLSVAKNSSAFVGGVAAKSCSSAYIQFKSLEGLSVADPTIVIFYSSKSIYRFSALSGVATEVSTS